MKRVLLIIVCLLIAGSSFAQKGFKIGVFAGPQLGSHLNAFDANLTAPTYTGSPLWGLNTGVSVGYHFVDMFGIKTQLVYSQQGNSYLRTVNDVETRFVDRLDYLKIPLLFGFNTATDRRKVSFVLFVGPQLSFLSRVAEYNDNADFGLIEGYDDSKIPLESGELIISRPGAELYIDQLFGLVGETGVDIRLSEENIYLNIRLRGDLTFGDLEDKSQNATTFKDGVSSTFSYWNNAHGASNNRNDITQALATALTIGITYNFSAN
ncbi:MAG: outer membrane beta-barrel protein [Bacteroidota bacterium]